MSSGSNLDWTGANEIVKLSAGLLLQTCVVLSYKGTCENRVRSCENLSKVQW